jgi:hypothetical protein
VHLPAKHLAKIENMNNQIIECNNYWVYLKNGNRFAVDLNMDYGEGIGDIKEIHDCINSDQRAMIFYQARPRALGTEGLDTREPMLLNLAEIAAITPITEIEKQKAI